MIKNVKNSILVESTVMKFVDKKYLTVVIHKSVKVHLQWNGQQYEGNCAGMDFESAGPAISKTLY